MSTKPHAPDNVKIVVLSAGDFHFGSGQTRISTLLGSCVSITLWHPRKHIGGMCHYLLPARTRKPGEPPDGRYGDEALAAMAATDVNTRWQTEMADFFVDLGDAQPDEGIAAIPEVFHLD